MTKEQRQSDRHSWPHLVILGNSNFDLYLDGFEANLPYTLDWEWRRDGFGRRKVVLQKSALLPPDGVGGKSMTAKDR